MYNAGMIYVNATGLDVSDTEAQTITGLYNALVGALATGKMIVLTGMVNGDASVSPTPVSVTLGAGATITLSGFAAVVSDADEVTPVA